MPKINQEEYEVLKGLDDEWKWIARDTSRNRHRSKLSKYKEKPKKTPYQWLAFNYEDIDDSKFKFIKWSDKEPYSISELIEEYESEETEVKDIKWARREVAKLFPGNVEAYVNQSDKTKNQLRVLNKVQSILDQLDEPETELESIYQDVLEQGSFKLEGIDYLVLEEKHYRDMEDAFNGKLNNSLVIEVPIIPQFVANYIKWFKNDFEHNFTADNDFIISLIQVSYKFSRREKIKNWISKSGNAQKLIDAYRWGYKVEEEQKYYVLDSEDIPLLEIANNQTCKTTTGLSIYEDGRDNSRFELTEQEIKDYDPRYMAFAKPVEELEE